ncbi:MAG: hypothetical protein ACREE1_00215, partial [Stellaceae bacterium]
MRLAVLLLAVLLLAIADLAVADLAIAPLAGRAAGSGNGFPGLLSPILDGRRGSCGAQFVVVSPTPTPTPTAAAAFFVVVRTAPFALI